MNRTIKFRGRRSDGTFVYGHYVNIHGDDFICDENSRGWLVTNVAQLVGYDSDGQEVYEGDEIDARNGTTWVAILGTTVTLPELAKKIREPLKVNGFKLKEADT